VAETGGGRDRSSGKIDSSGREGCDVRLPDLLRQRNCPRHSHSHSVALPIDEEVEA